MAYTGVNWQNKPNTASPINAANLEIMDNGITEADANATAAKTEVEDVRTGLDGTTYTSAGNAVRGQINGVYNALDSTNKMVDNMLELGAELTKGTTWNGFIINENGGYSAETGNSMQSYVVGQNKYVYVNATPKISGKPVGGFYSQQTVSSTYLIQRIDKPGTYAVPTGTSHVILSYKTDEGCTAKVVNFKVDEIEDVKAELSDVEEILSDSFDYMAYEKEGTIVAGNCITSGLAYRVSFTKEKFLDKLVITMKAGVDNQDVIVEWADSNTKTRNVFASKEFTIGTTQADYTFDIKKPVQANTDYFVRIMSKDKAKNIGFITYSATGNSDVVVGNGYYTMSTTDNEAITSANAQIRYIGKIYLSPEVEQDRTELILAESGGDYTSLSDALTYCAAHTETLFDIIVKPGTYNENNLLYEKGNVNIIGEDREKCIFVTDGTETPSVPLANRHFLMVHCYMEIKNVTIRVNDVKYCLHQDSGSNAYLICDNVHFIFTGTAPTFYFCVGIGMHQKEHNEFYNCIFENTMVTNTNIPACGVFCHNWNNQPAPAVLIIEDCEFINTGIAHISELGSAQPDLARIKNCHTDANIGIILSLTPGYYKEGGVVVDDPLLIPYCIDVDIINTDCPIEIRYDNRPEWKNVFGVFDRVKNIGASDIKCGEAVAIDKSQFNYRFLSCSKATSGCDGVAVVDNDSGDFGFIAGHGKTVMVKCSAGSYAFGDSLTVSNGVFSVGETKDAVCMETKTLGAVGYVMAQIQ